MGKGKNNESFMGQTAVDDYSKGSCRARATDLDGTWHDRRDGGGDIRSESWREVRLPDRTG